ncbi:hypothetical protein ACLOJK_041834 [Asimina triloba]
MKIPQNNCHSPMRRMRGLQSRSEVRKMRRSLLLIGDEEDEGTAAEEDERELWFWARWETDHAILVFKRS